jgi:hypothetical protein
MGKYHKETRIFEVFEAPSLFGVRRYTMKGLVSRFVEGWRDEYAHELNGRKVRVTIEIEPSPEDLTEDKFEQEFDDNYH